MPITQENREVKISTPLGEDVLLLRNMNITEELGRLFTINLELLSTQEDIKFEELLGQNITIEMKLLSGGKRFFNGHITRFSQAENSGNYSTYQATVHPWLWFLTRTADCRIFQNKTVPEIINKVFRDLGFTNFKEKFNGHSYRTWEYCVQYRETDFSFISRLMEQEGIYYYFKHKKGVHTLILANGYASHDSLPDAAKIPYYPANETAIREEHISSWYVSKQVQSGKYELNEFDFERPKANLISRSSIPREYATSKYEIYDYPGEYNKTDDGENYAQARIEELQSQYEQVQGQSNVRAMQTGSLFKLTNYSREDQNREYLIASVTHHISSDNFGSGRGNTAAAYSNSFTVIESQTPFRPARTSPKPIIQGTQTAMVVGPAGETIHTDKYGRVKLQFHWDRHGKSDENSSCWVRVSQNWAGKKWGDMHIPHVGHEVIVSFLEGDPDQPIVTGRVYNAINMPKEALAGNKTKTVWSDHGGNQIIMEGKEGDKSIHIKQTCGNEIRMHENTPDIEIKQACGNAILMKAKGSDIEIKQKCGNEILMHEAKGIQMRDKYGNEVVLDSAAKFIRIASPSHDSYIELGKSLKWGSNSDDTLIVGGDQKATIAGWTHRSHLGIKTDISLTANFSSINGINVKKYYAYENSVNYKGRKKRTKGAVSVDSDTSYEIIGGVEDNAQLMLDIMGAKLSSGGNEITDGFIFIDNNGIQVRAKKGDVRIGAPGGKINLKTKCINLKANTTHITKGTFKHKNIEVKP